MMRGPAYVAAQLAAQLAAYADADVAAHANAEAVAHAVAEPKRGHARRGAGLCRPPDCH
jgi:hypothetical protein